MMLMNDDKFRTEAERTLWEARRAMLRQSQRDARIALAFATLSIGLAVFSIWLRWGVV